MHIWSCLKNFLYDKDNFIALYDNYIYIYNFTKVLSISSKEIKMLIQDKKVKISGLDLKIIKWENTNGNTNILRKSTC